MKVVDFFYQKVKNLFLEYTIINSRNISTALLHQKTFLPYKNYCHGEKAIVVCGAGPTLQEYQPIEGAVHIALNRAFLYPKVAFDFVFAQDFDGIKMVQQELIEYRGNSCVKLLGKSNGGPKEIPESLVLKCNALRFATDAYMIQSGWWSQFVLDIDSRPIGNMPNVGLSVMQFALYMNPSKIYLVGCDMSGGHFTNRNQAIEEIETEKQELEERWGKQEKLIAKWKECKEFASKYYPDTQIISVNPVGLKGVFKDWYQKEED